MRDSARVLPTCGAVAQLGERLNGIQEVEGSTPFGSTPAIPFQTRSPVKSARQGSSRGGGTWLGLLAGASDARAPHRDRLLRTDEARRAFPAAHAELPAALNRPRAGALPVTGVRTRPAVEAREEALPGPAARVAQRRGGRTDHARRRNRRGGGGRRGRAAEPDRVRGQLYFACATHLAHSHGGAGETRTMAPRTENRRVRGGAGEYQGSDARTAKSARHGAPPPPSAYLPEPPTVKMERARCARRSVPGDGPAGARPRLLAIGGATALDVERGTKTLRSDEQAHSPHHYSNLPP